MALSDPAIAAISLMADLDFKLVDGGGSLYIQRPADRGGSQWYVGAYSDDYWTGWNAAAVAGAVKAQAIVDDETARLALGTPTWGRPGSRAAG